MRDVHSDIKAVAHVVAAAPTATVTPANGVDTADFNACEFVIAIGTVPNAGSGSWTFKLQESDDDSTFTDVEDPKEVLIGSTKAPVQAPSAGTPEFLTVDAAPEDATVYRVGYIGSKRYVRVVATAVSTPGATPLAITAILARPALRPTQD